MKSSNVVTASGLADAQATRVLISLLNWNSSDDTLVCLASIFAQRVPSTCEVTVQVIDNASHADDISRLKAGMALTPATLILNNQNTGFAAGHNASIEKAIAENFDFIWLINSDLVVEKTCLEKMLRTMKKHPECGATSPVIVSMDEDDRVDFCGARHDWKNAKSVHAETIAEARSMERNFPHEMWVAGTAVLYQIAALATVGKLDEEYFAYFEDNDMSARLAAKGWTSLMTFDASIRHKHTVSAMLSRPSYYFYLMTRNGHRFWTSQTGSALKKLKLALKLTDQALYQAALLDTNNLPEKANACLLGLSDAHVGRYGRPLLGRSVPLYLRLMALIRKRHYQQHIALNAGRFQAG